ncbi:universal stress protein [Luteibacter sp. dw_328]|uniref:universal stress protein n=1 Tax=Luteibacter sp. dw_328 TaxID=2719796 RepID=UPI001BD5E2CA|nr:universal stress protein [Luteibacter sp. dw_328]
MFKHILIATDGSDASTRAADQAIGLAAQLGSKVLVLCVEPPTPAFVYIAEAIQGADALPAATAKRTQGCLSDVCAKAQAAGVPFSSQTVIDSRPYCEIVSIAAREHCDLIVMGSHGTRGLDRLLLGSETHKVLLSTDISVLVCH